MYPSRSVMDYNMNDINKLFQRNDADVFNSIMTPSSSNHSMFQSSSSTETSPDSFPDTPHKYELFKQGINYEYEHRQPGLPQRTTRSDLYENFIKPDFFDRTNDFTKPELTNTDTPLFIKRLRPITGRKLMTSTENIPKIEDVNLSWHTDEFVDNTPPKQTYELFPVENRGFRTPTQSPIYSSSPLQASPRIVSPVFPNMSPCKPLMSSPCRPVMQSPFKEPRAGPSGPLKPTYHTKICTFCRKNGEAPIVFTTHVVKAKIGNRQVVTCPILRSLVCSTCGESGDNAHTITYCPVVRNSNNGQPLKSTTITLKSTRVKSNGKRRY